MNIAHHWPDVPPAAFTILRQIAQEVQRQAVDDPPEVPLMPGELVGAASLAAACAMMGTPEGRRSLIQAAALLVRAIDGIDEREQGRLR